MDNPIFVANLDSRQQTLSGYVELDVGDFVNRGNVIDVELPPNAEITDGALSIITASDQQTTDTVSVGDTVNATRYLGATSIKQAAGTRAPLVPTGYVTTPSNNKLRFTRAVAGNAATVGTIRIWYSYVALGQSDFTQG